MAGSLASVDLLNRPWAVALLMALPQAGSAQSLREVLGEFELPSGPGGPDLDQRITSYAENWPDLFVIPFSGVVDLGPDIGPELAGVSRRAG